ncbi:MAG: HdeD family acid-resistance protein [Desulfobaccales bacterium]
MDANEITFINTSLSDIQGLQKNWGWLLALGIISIILGILALGSSAFFTVASMIFFGWILLIIGILEMVHSLWNRHWGGFFLHLFYGILAFVAGVIMIGNPAGSAVILTLMMAMFFMVTGLFRIITVLAMRFPSWQWRLCDGIITLLLGILLWAQWPFSGLWAIGMFIGIALIFSGWSSVMLALAARHLPPRTA